MRLTSGQTVNDFCDRGQLDSAVRTKNGRIFVFFGPNLIELNDRLEIVKRNPTPIRDVFRGFAFDVIDASFTADGQNNPNRGKTYLIRNKEIQEFRDQTPTGLRRKVDEWRGYGITWDMEKLTLVINQRDDNMAIFFDADERFIATQQSKINIFVFDNLTEPSHVPVTKGVWAQKLIQFPLQQQRLMLRAVLSLSNGSYLALYKSISGMGGKYCITQSLIEGVNFNFNFDFHPF